MVDYSINFEDIVKQCWNRPSLSDYMQDTFQYREVAQMIARMHILFREIGLQPGDKVAVCGRNASRWGVAFLSVFTYGAVPVPILHEFHPDQIQDIINHSEARLLFVGDQVWGKLQFDTLPNLLGCICIQNFSILAQRSEKLQYAADHINLLFGKAYPKGFSKEDVHYYRFDPEELCVINYTSGTTSNSKGVMIPWRAICSNLDFAQCTMASGIVPGENTISILPMAHMYGLTFEFLHMFRSGIHIHFLTKLASPSVLMKALADVKPIIIVSVPLILDKVVRKAVFPKIQTPAVQAMLKVPFLATRIKKKICQQLRDAMGGHFTEFVIGGAALNPEVETLLLDIGFPFTVGYGATECAPIICYEDWFNVSLGSCGKPAKNMEVRIDSTDPSTIPGEILVHGPNVMLGYYKNPEATSQCLDSEGWFHTGDLGIMDEKKNLFIKGRIKNMLLGSNGQNIYPEEIEDKLSCMPGVAETVVVQRQSKLVALIYPVQEMLQTQGREAILELMEKNRLELNPQLPHYSQIAQMELVDEEFEKTPKRSIKRFKYK